MNKILRTVNTRELREAREDEALAAELKAIEDLKNAPRDENDVPIVDDKQVKALQKRYDDLRSWSAKKENDLKKEVDALKAQLADATKKQIKFPKTEEEVAEWVQKYPDVAAIVETIAMKKVQELRSDVDKQSTMLAEQKYEVEFNRCMNRIISVHPNFLELREDDDFIEWISTQPKKIRSVFETETPIDIDDLEDAADTAIYAIKVYNLETSKAKPAKKADDNRDAARTVLNRSNTPAPVGDKRPDLVYESDIDKLTPRQYTDEIDEMVNKAMREGRFVYDGQSGAAR